MKEKKEEKSMDLKVTDDLTVTILPNSDHEFLMSTKDVAAGYDINVNTLRSHKSQNKNELIEGTHFISGVQILNGAVNSTKTTMWTKKGVIRLGFFIKSERAKLFRDWIENLVLKFIDKQLPSLPETPKRKHNRLTAERLLDIMSDIVKIEDSELRQSISRKILGG
jgi:prophage antirepressor-like protein